MLEDDLPLPEMSRPTMRKKRAMSSEMRRTQTNIWSSKVVSSEVVSSEVVSGSGTSSVHMARAHTTAQKHTCMHTHMGAEVGRVSGSRGVQACGHVSVEV